jgi:hypothetical protein
MSLNAAIAGLNTIFTSPTAGVGESIYHIPGGRQAYKEPINAVVDWDAEEGAGDNRGDQRRVNQDQGRAVRRTIVVECAVTVAINESGNDQFEVTDPKTGDPVLIAVKRIIGRDAGMQSVLCVATQEYQAQKGRRIG